MGKSIKLGCKKRSSRQPRIKLFGHILERGKSTYKHSASRVERSCKIGSNGATQRPTIKNKIAGLKPLLKQPIKRSLGRCVATLLGRFTHAFTIPRVIKNQHSHLEKLKPSLHSFESKAEISTITMAVQDRFFWFAHRGWNPPGVDFIAIACLKPQFFNAVAFRW